MSTSGLPVTVYTFQLNTMWALEVEEALLSEEHNLVKAAADSTIADCRRTVLSDGPRIETTGAELDITDTVNVLEATPPKKLRRRALIVYVFEAAKYDSGIIIRLLTSDTLTVFRTVCNSATAAEVSLELTTIKVKPIHALPKDPEELEKSIDRSSHLPRKVGATTDSNGRLAAAGASTDVTVSFIVIQ
jgi:hypothetical protein